MDGYRFIEKFNRDMMNQFMEYQQQVSASQLRYEEERRRQEQIALEQWRQEAREHEKQMFGIFCGILSNCNAALNVLLKARLEQNDSKTSGNDKQNNADGDSNSSEGDKSPQGSTTGSTTGSNTGSTSGLPNENGTSEN